MPRTESPGGIRSAYRDLARKLHPDVAGEQATHAFQEVTEAYDVLSDPQRRRAYNDELRRAEDGHVVPVRVGAPPPRRAPVSIFDAAEPIRPSAEAMYERLRRNFTGVGVPKSERLEALNIEVLLTPEEGGRGCVLPVGVPVFRRCPDCGGSGRDWLFPCLACGQQGIIEEEQVVRIRIPPLARSGAVFEMPLQGLGIHNFWLRLHVFVESGAMNERR
ncbi:MAG TPA: DnaJ domain-containing protein [Polyangia bacterium]|nr:DnaJ domain-containing protein [Polyangia bacterium]